MSVLQTITDVKIPYASEGVIRTAQIDDTVSPENSVQLAVNMNFDRVGAIQTRAGVTEYADDLEDRIENYATLRNSIVPPGFAKLYQIGDESSLASDFEDPAAVKIGDDKVSIFWRGADGDGFCQNFRLSEVGGTLTPIGTVVEFDTSSNSDNCAIQLETVTGFTRVLNVWKGTSGDAFAQVFNVGADTIVPLGSPLEFDTSNGEAFTLALIDSTHVICFYRGASNNGIATVFAIDGSGNVTEPGSPLTFTTGDNFSTNSCSRIGSSNDYICIWTTGTGGKAQAFTVNTGTWAITANGTAYTFDSVGFMPKISPVGDGEHFIAVFQGSTSGRFEAETLEVNLGTLAVTSVGTSVLLSPGGGNDINVASFEDGEHFVAFYTRNIGDGNVQMFEMDPVTYDLSLIGDVLDGYDFAGDPLLTAFNIDSNKVMAVWGNDDGIEGKSAMFASFGAVTSGRWLYAATADEVFNTAPGDGGAWVSRRSGLATVSKPRFSQYLNYVWMVNGNEFIGGDPVATSDGGDFGTDLVPAGFPAGDFIHAGFEGRVWVANKTLGVIYYTDIVQFIPPATYTLSYNPEVNFITTISPNTGQSITALYRVPRALLVFTEDSITRIYGASSIDAYPAYQVGTFSQESIIETKTGIFFHHSSGFYQFDYGSQPVEISRRIIDFVKAIPRSSYDDITGVWDGFDNVEWSVGQVTVEGVVYVNCVLRYTISTQVWTVYDYPGNVITAMIYYDDGEDLNHLMGCLNGEGEDQVAKTGAMDTGDDDFGEPFYYEMIDRWRAYTEMYYKTKAISGLSVYHENASGANVLFQAQKSGPNAWKQVFTLTEQCNSMSPNTGTDDFEVGRLRIAGTTKGARVVIHGIEITTLTIKGQDTN